MAFKDIHKLKKIAVVEREVITTPYLVVGKDVFSLSLYTELKTKHGQNNVRLLSEDAILKSDLLPKGPSSVRGENNQRVFKALYPDVVVTKCNENSLFYKDMTWKSFGGRSKSEALKYDEGYFTGDRTDPDFEAVLKNVSHSDEFIASMNAVAYQVKIKSIGRAETGFIVECINGTEFHCEYLYFGLSPYYYQEFYKEKNQLSPAFIEFCESTKTSSALFVKYVFEAPLSDMKETLFIPLSYTHEWGHFVGEFREKEGKQEIEFMHFLEDQLMSEEDISRIIRLLKKNMEKIFDKFNKIKFYEYISLEQEIGCLKIDDHKFEQSLNQNPEETKALFFIGINAPVVKQQCVELNFEYSQENLSGVVRALLIQHNHTKKFE
ncbi:MAG: hypothetical protein K2Q18_01595 [Bdellovibrionales bacterium]|nr:hypothetical protein [Bdellovibrionales bacterium]